MLLYIRSGCPEAIKLLVGNKSDLSPEVNMKDCKVLVEFCINLITFYNLAVLILR